jgi:hypothetical protein
VRKVKTKKERKQERKNERKKGLVTLVTNQITKRTYQEQLNLLLGTFAKVKIVLRDLKFYSHVDGHSDLLRRYTVSTDKMATDISNKHTAFFKVIHSSRGLLNSEGHHLPFDRTYNSRRCRLPTVVCGGWPNWLLSCNKQN